MGYMLVQLIAVLLLPVGVFRFAKIWVDERAASYAALGSIFLGALAFLVYQAGQLATVSSAALYLNALPYFYEWAMQASGRSLIKGVALSLTAAAAHHVTLIFGVVFFAGPVLWIACMDAREERRNTSLAGVISRALVFAVMVGVGVGIVLLPYWMALIQHPIHQIPIPHDSRSNFLLNSITAINYFVIPYGALILALPFIILRGSSVPRLRPLLIGFWLSLIFGLGGTTPLPRWLLGRAYDILTFERFTFWATLLAMPIVGLLAVESAQSLPCESCCRAFISGSGHNRCGTRVAKCESIPSHDHDGCQSRDLISEPGWARFVSISHPGLWQRVGASINLHRRQQR